MILAVKHNIEVAHRLYEAMSGKCERIHGHSMKVTLNLDVEFDPVKHVAVTDGKVVEFGEVKKVFREFLDTDFDHRLLLNRNDPFAGSILPVPSITGDGVYPDDVIRVKGEQLQRLPGLNPIDGDPTTENIARIIAMTMSEQFTVDCVVEVWETDVNNATFGWSYTNEAELFTEPYPGIR